MGLRLVAAALLAATAHGACEACMKYLDATWRTACNETWANEFGYDDCPPPASGCCIVMMPSVSGTARIRVLHIH